MRIRVAVACGLAALAVGVAGCGSGSGSASTARSTSAARSTGSAQSRGTGTTGTGTTGGAIFGAPSGREVFASACRLCHSISGHNRPSQQGGDLRAFHGSKAELRQLTAEMPVIHHRLSPAELTAVVNYVANIERSSR